MSSVHSKNQPRYLVYSRSEPHPYLLPGQFVHRVEVRHDPTSPRPLRGSRHFKGYALYDAATNQLVRLFVFIEPGHTFTEWMLPAPASIEDIQVRHGKDGVMVRTYPSADNTTTTPLEHPCHSFL